MSKKEMLRECDEDNRFTGGLGVSYPQICETSFRVKNGKLIITINDHITGQIVQHDWKFDIEKCKTIDIYDFFLSRIFKYQKRLCYSYTFQDMLEQAPYVAAIFYSKTAFFHLVKTSHHYPNFVYYNLINSDGQSVSLLFSTEKYINMLIDDIFVGAYDLSIDDGAESEISFEDKPNRTEVTLKRNDFSMLYTLCNEIYNYYLNNKINISSD